MKVLVACEYSAIVRDAFRKEGHDAWSCDILPTEGDPEYHICGSVLDVLNDGWDLMVAHPPCTYLTVTANRHFVNNPDRWRKRLESVEFVWELWNANIPHIAIENPVGVLGQYIGKQQQIIQPYEFGDPVLKRTCLWLKNLPPLTFTPDMVVEPEVVEYKSSKTKSGVSRYAKAIGPMGSGHGHERSRFFPGVAKAMAEQWGSYIKEMK